MQPIEFGCLAVVIKGHPDNLGKFVTVGNRIEDKLCRNKKLWSIDRLLIFYKCNGVGMCSGAVVLEPFVPEMALRRVDGHEGEVSDVEVVSGYRSKHIINKVV